MLAKAKAAGIRLVGPNCMGLYCPAGGVTFGGDFPKEPGGVAFISQSGLNGEDLVHNAALRGVRFSKVISYGNATDLDESDFFEYCTADPQTEIILSYIEGVKDGRRFQRALRAAAAVKPTVLLKGGADGRRRTGDAVAHGQPRRLAAGMGGALPAGGRRVASTALDELVDMAVTFHLLKPPKGTRRRHHRRRRRLERAGGGHGGEAGAAAFHRYRKMRRRSCAASRRWPAPASAIRSTPSRSKTGRASTRPSRSSASRRTSTASSSCRDSTGGWTACRTSTTMVQRDGGEDEGGGGREPRAGRAGAPHAGQRHDDGGVRACSTRAARRPAWRSIPDFERALRAMARFAAWQEARRA